VIGTPAVLLSRSRGLPDDSRQIGGSPEPLAAVPVSTGKAGNGDRCSCSTAGGPLFAWLVVAIVVSETTWARLIRHAILSVTLVVAFWTSTRAAPSAG
jgi:hypothetical protein